MSLSIPDGCLLVQAGQQFEYLTGGHVRAGFHEVVVTPQTVQALERARAEGRPCWRVSSTVRLSVCYDVRCVRLTVCMAVVWSPGIG